MNILHLFKGAPAPLKSNQKIITAINRTEVDILNVYKDSIEGDEVYNKIHHGGLQRVIHHYPLEHYIFWKNLFPGTHFSPGLMGENISTAGLTEENVCIGDTYRIGSTLCVVSEPRKPCATINHQFQITGFARKVQSEAKTGWFYKIFQEGIIRSGDEIILEERLYPELTIKECVQALLVHPDRVILEMMGQNPALSNNWRIPAREFLKSGTLPDDRGRLGELP